MKSLLAAIILLPLHALGAQSTLHSLTPSGVYVQTDSGPISLDSIAANTAVSTTDPIAVRTEQQVAGNTVVHARTKAGLRMLEGLPAVRIYEAGFATALIPAIQSRRFGTTASTSAASVTPGPHSWLLRVTGYAGRRLRLQVRFRSSVVGTGITGSVGVDVGNDGSVEFTRGYDGNKHLSNHGFSLDSTGVRVIKIESRAAGSSSSAGALSYAAVLDVSVEPIPEAVSTFVAYGSSCGPKIAPSMVLTPGQVQVQLSLSGAPANAAAMLAIGTQKAQIQLPGNCNLLTDVLAVGSVGTTDSSGNLTTVLPPVAVDMSIVGNLQYGIINSSGGLLTSDAVRYEARAATGRSFDYFDQNYILSTGQSLAIGWAATAVTKTQPYQNKMFETGVCGAAGTRFVPLIESVRETHHSSMANLITKLAEDEVFATEPPPRDTHEVFATCSGAIGVNYLGLKKGSALYKNLFDQLQAALALSSAGNKSTVVRILSNVHGENDDQQGNLNYAQNLLEWQQDVEKDVRALNGQLHPVPMLHSQINYWTSMFFNRATSVVVTQQLAASVANPRKIVLVGPKYIFPHSTSDGTHLQLSGYQHMGEYYGRVYRHIILEGGTWEPLRPLATSRSGAEIRVRFHVPVPPLVLDTTLVTNPGSYGFEYHDDSAAPATILGVVLEDEDTVRITLSKTPTGANKLIRYAYTGIKGANGGPLTGARGNLRDSDDSISRFSWKLHNWCVHFSEPVQ